MADSTLPQDIVTRASSLAKLDCGGTDGLIDEALSSASSSALKALTILVRYTDDDAATRNTAAVALALKGPEGLRALREAATDAQRMKTSTTFFLVAAAVAAASFGHLMVPLYALRRDLAERATIVAQADPGLREAAREVLVDYLLEGDPNFVWLKFGQALLMLNATADRATVATRDELLAAASARWLTIGGAYLREFDELQMAASDDEPALHRFLEEHPSLLDPAVAQLWSKPNLHGRYEVDFVLRRFDDTYVVVEIETPAKRLYTAQQPTAYLTHAMQQGRDYHDYLRQHLNDARRLFPRYAPDAEILIVIGRENELDDAAKAKLANLVARQHGVSIVGFDTLSKQARTVRSNLFARIDTVLRARL